MLLSKTDDFPWRLHVALASPPHSNKSTMKNQEKTMTTEELMQAVGLLIERQESLDRQQRRRAQLRLRRRREQTQASISKLAYSIEVIKWCVVGITTVMVLSLLVIILVVNQVKGEVEKVTIEVERIQHEAEAIRDKIRHPLETLGATMGRRLEGSIGEYIGGDVPESE